MHQVLRHDIMRLLAVSGPCLLTRAVASVLLSTADLCRLTSAADLSVTRTIGAPRRAVWRGGALRTPAAGALHGARAR